jgi:putative flippase GtrA
MDGRFDPPGVVGQLLRYGMTGGAGLLVNVGLLVVLVDLLQFSPVWSPLVSTGVALTLTLFVTERWVFARYGAEDGRALATRAPGYYLVMIAGKAANYGIYLLLLATGVPYALAWVIGSAIVFFGTFTANRFVWRRTAGDPGGRL